VAALSKRLVLRPHAFWDGGFESFWEHECLSLVSVLYCRVEALQLADHSSRGVLLNVVCLNVIENLIEET